MAITIVHNQLWELYQGDQGKWRQDWCSNRNTCKCKLGDRFERHQSSWPICSKLCGIPVKLLKI